ncbi:PREDICTED: nucleolar and spindle-associated protein 1-like isoform X2 [Priapulus caudatus]|uniref:Nucleolar and spindle-associated protein 1-like isoform X2 n=1 Tax=Priapulus caudatus TaxID=37621 RepID=A0ABM1EXI3_PRICU|nr:PREDICTED: nucleolar and spindle-associated protein 1-like isoform X2 [Priapulus caudatus]
MDTQVDVDLLGKLKTVKYGELQKLAKGVGIKANQKSKHLLAALTEYYRLIKVASPTGNANGNTSHKTMDNDEEERGIMDEEEPNVLLLSSSEEVSGGENDKITPIPKKDSHKALNKTGRPKRKKQATADEELETGALTEECKDKSSPAPKHNDSGQNIDVHNLTVTLEREDTTPSEVKENAEKEGIKRLPKKKPNQKAASRKGRMTAQQKAAAMSPVSAALGAARETRSAPQAPIVVETPPVALKSCRSFMSPTVASMARLSGKKSLGLVASIPQKRDTFTIEMSSTGGKRKRSDAEDEMAIKKAKSDADKSASKKSHTTELFGKTYMKRKSSYTQKPVPTAAQIPQQKLEEKTDKTPQQKLNVSKTQEKPIRSSERLRSKTNTPGSSTKTCSADTDLKAQIIAELDKKVEEKRTLLSIAGSKDISGTTSHIPRFIAFAAQKSGKKTYTPGAKNFASKHQQNFNKIAGQSIEHYLEMKRKRTEQLTASVVRAREVAAKTREAVSRLNASVKKPFVPMATSVADATFRFARTADSENISASPKVTKKKSMSEIDETHGSATRNKSSLPLYKKQGSNRKTILKPTSVIKSSEASNQQNECKFDLKASLQKKLSYKPYVGKLEPLREKRGVVSRTHLHPANKTGPTVVAGRNNRRQAMADKQANMRANQQMLRRGLV